jgi:hypothetical protein
LEYALLFRFDSVNAVLTQILTCHSLHNLTREARLGAASAPVLSQSLPLLLLLLLAMARLPPHRRYARTADVPTCRTLMLASRPGSSQRSCRPASTRFVRHCSSRSRCCVASAANCCLQLARLPLLLLARHVLLLGLLPAMGFLIRLQWRCHRASLEAASRHSRLTQAAQASEMGSRYLRQNKPWNASVGRPGDTQR